MDPFEEEKSDNNKRIVWAGVLSALLCGGCALLGACIFISRGALEFLDNPPLLELETPEAVHTAVASTAVPTIDLVSGQDEVLADNLSGQYTVEGTNPISGTYTGSLTITQTGEFYAAEWNIGEQIFTGTGLLRDNVFSVSWGGQECAALHYTVAPDGSLNGVWFWVTEPNQLGTEYIAPLEDGSENLLVGTHEMSGVDPDGNTYDGTSEISVNGSVYTIIWYVGEDVIPATGVRQGDVISVGWGEETCSIASYIVAEDGTLSGVWANVGEGVLGSETGAKVGR